MSSEFRYYTDEELDQMSHGRLYRHFTAARTEASRVMNYYGIRCCEICKEYVGYDWERDVGQHLRIAEDYRDRVKAALQRRPYQDFSKRAKVEAQREKVADLKGNRRQRH